VRLLRTLVPLALVAGLVAGCGGGSSSSAAPAASGKALQLRPVYAKYDSNAPTGEQLGPQAPKALLDTLKSFDCSSGPQELQGLMLACDTTGAVYVLKDPLTTGGVASAVAKPIHGEKLWWVKLALDTQATSTLAQAVRTMTGTELALVVDGHVVSAPILQPSMSDGTLGVTGDYDEQQAKALAAQLGQN
jgi:preprotein translocase subunit SecD